MPTPRSAARIALDEALADGAWHDRAEIINLIAPHVPPGKAIRRTHRLRAHMAAVRRRQGAVVIPANARPGDDQAVDARDIARCTIAGATSIGAIEKTTTPDGTVLIRKAP